MKRVLFLLLLTIAAKNTTANHGDTLLKVKGKFFQSCNQSFYNGEVVLIGLYNRTEWTGKLRIINADQISVDGYMLFIDSVERIASLSNKMRKLAGNRVQTKRGFTLFLGLAAANGIVLIRGLTEERRNLLLGTTTLTTLIELIHFQIGFQHIKLRKPYVLKQNGNRLKVKFPRGTK
jgi:hypothetical protein